jgi:LacI family transcriptional regulator
MQPIRLQDIADKVGVSRSTVSLALRNHPSLPASTCARIRQVAEAMGYRPNPLVSALMTYQRQTKPVKPTYLTLAFVAKYARQDPWQFYLSPDLITAAAARAELQGYHLEEFWLGNLQMSSQRLWQVLYQRGVPGVILAPLPLAHSCFPFDWSHFSSVAIGYSLVQPELHRVSSHRARAMILAVQRLRQKGYQRLGLAIDADQDARVDHQWAAAFLWEQGQINRAHRTSLFLVGREQWTEQRFAKWFKDNQPEVILSYDPQVISWLSHLGKHVPRDVGFAHLWNPDQSGKYAGLYHNPPALGAAAVDFLVAMIQRNERGIPAIPQTLLLEPTWVDGASLQA